MAERLAERRLQVFRFRRAGMSYSDIATKLGCAIGTVHRDVKIEMAKLEDELTDSVQGYRAMENARLDQLWSLANAETVKIGKDGVAVVDIKAIETALKISARRSALLGLDASNAREVIMPVELLLLIRAKGLSAHDLFQAMLMTLSEDTPTELQSEDEN